MYERVRETEKRENEYDRVVVSTDISHKGPI